MRGVVLADAGPLFALRDPTDTLHERSVADERRLKSNSLKTAVSYSALTECHALILHKLGISEGRTFLNELTRTSYFVSPTPQDYEEAADRIHHYSDQQITLADAVLAEISNRLDIPVWTYDHHFDVMGIRVWRDA